MITCPICNIANDDLARFCAECGQRLGPTEPQGAPQSNFNQAPPFTPPAPPTMPQQAPPVPPTPGPGFSGQGQQMPPAPPQPSLPPMPPANPAQPLSQNAAGASPPPTPKLRSPMLNTDDYEEEAQPQLRPVGKSRPLRSPLLGGEEEDDEPVMPQSKRGLKSPLLGDNAGPDVSDRGTGGKPKKFRSPLLGDSHEDEYEYDEPVPESKGKHSLHSPLLGGSDDSHSHFPHRKIALPGSDEVSEPTEGTKPVLRSRLLGGGTGHFDEYEEEIEDYSDDPTVLRSPLLAARSHREKPAITPEAKQPTAPQPPANAPAVQTPPIQANQTQPPMQQAPVMPPAPPVQPSMPQQFASASSPPQVQHQVQQAPVASSGQSAPTANFAPEMPPPPPIGVNYVPPAQKPFETAHTEPKPVESKSLGSEISEPPIPQWGNVSANVHTHPSRPADEVKPAPAKEYQSEELNALRFPQAPKPAIEETREVPEPPRPRLGSKMLGTDSQDEDELPPRSTRFAAPESRSGGSSIAPACAVPLFLALAMKLWVMFEIFKSSQLSGIVMMDNIAQVLVILALLALCLLGFKNR